MELNAQRFTGRISDNDIRLLRTFCTVVRHGGFVAAESELQIGLPSISRYIKDLEIRLGLRLCDRGRRGFALTSEGKQVHDACMKLFNNLDDFEHEVRDIHANPAGAVRIGMVDTLVHDPHLDLPAAIRAYKRNFPNIIFNFSTSTSNLIEQEVMDGTIDIGIIFERRVMEQLNYYLLFEEISYLFGSESHPLVAKYGDDIENVDLSIYEFVGSPMPHMMEKMGVSGLFRRSATATSMEAIAMLINSDTYIGFLPEEYVRSLRWGNRFRKIAPTVFTFDSRISAITRSGKVSPFVSNFVNLLVPDAALGVGAGMRR